MMIGYLAAGVTGGLVSATGSVALGFPATAVLVIYSLSGMVSMVGFGVFAERAALRR